MWEYILSTIGGTVLGSLSGWLVGRRKQRIDEIDAATETWKKIVDSLQIQIDKLLEQRQKDSEKIDALTCETVALNKQVQTLRDELENLQQKVKSINRLEKTIARYEKLMDEHKIEY